MKGRYLASISLLVVLSVAVAGIIVRHHKRIQEQPFELNGNSLSAFTSLDPIDVHTHVYHDSPDLVAMLERLHLHVLAILYVDDTDSYSKAMEPQRSDALKFVAASNRHGQFCTTFDPFKFNQRNFAASAIKGLNQDFARGAVAAKIWKNIGMEIVDESGNYIMPDDARFQPIYADIAGHDKTLIIHAAEPDEAWGLHPPGSYPKYYENHPQWDMSNKATAPKKEDILAARDHLLAMNPNLRVVGAHFGSLEDHLDEVAARLDLYPNFAVDTAARVIRLVFQPRDKVRAFILKHQDRILYGTDLHVSADGAGLDHWERQYARDWRYFATDDTFEYVGHEVKGLDLPRPVLKKLYHDNAIRWIPGIDGDSH